MPDDLLIEAARAWDALRRHAGAEQGSTESRQIAEDLMSILRRAGRESAIDNSDNRSVTV